MHSPPRFTKLCPIQQIGFEKNEARNCRIAVYAEIHAPLPSNQANYSHFYISNNQITNILMASRMIYTLLRKMAKMVGVYEPSKYCDIIGAILLMREII